MSDTRNINESKLNFVFIRFILHINSFALIIILTNLSFVTTWPLVRMLIGLFGDYYDDTPLVTEPC